MAPFRLLALSCLAAWAFAFPAASQDTYAQQYPAYDDEVHEEPLAPAVQAIIDAPQTTIPDPAETGDITPPNEPPAPPGDALEPKPPEYEDMPQVELRILDKVRAESRTYILNVGRTVAYANIRIRPRACRKSSPLDDPENASFLQIWEVKPDGVSAWIFSGWMFASSPSISAMDHPVYDVTVLDCKNPATASQSDSQPEEEEAAPADDTSGDGDSDEPAPETAAEGEMSTNETSESDSADSSAE